MCTARHERTGRVDHPQSTRHRLFAHERRDAVGRKDAQRAPRHLVELVDEHGAAPLQVVGDVHVMHDLLAHVDRRAVALERPLDDLDGPPRAGAERPRPGQQQWRADRSPEPRPKARARPGAARARRGGSPVSVASGRVSSRSGVSSTTRKTATGRPAAPAASHADSMSTASTPAARQQVALGAAHDMVGRGDGPDVDPCDAQRRKRRHKRSARAGGTTPCGAAYLAGHHDVAGAQPAASRAAETWRRRRRRPANAPRACGGARPRGAHAAAQHEPRRAGRAARRHARGAARPTASRSLSGRGRPRVRSAALTRSPLRGRRRPRPPARSDPAPAAGTPAGRGGS